MRRLPLIAAALMAVALLLPVGLAGEATLFWPGAPQALICALAAIAVAAALARPRTFPLSHVLPTIGLLVGALAPLLLVFSGRSLGLGAPGVWVFVIGLGLLAWQAMEGLARSARTGASGIAAPLLFGAWLLYLWEVVVVGFGVPQILLPSPHQIFAQLTSHSTLLWADFRQTFLKAVLAGWALGCGLGFLTAVLIDRVPFLQRGLLPLGSLVSAVPIVGVAPIMVMWFGFDWQSKAAVIVVMTFFPMLINTIAGLNQADAMELDLMRSYGAGYWQTFFKLRLPSALPFAFNALKINSTLALIGAIVAEFFGSPISGMGFRISVEVARMNVDVVWATIAVAAVAGSAFYGLLALLERGFTFWHPSYRT
ncbi:MAG TPA: ABC transporter permease [Alphaproteobacteria bacterium]|nr:ABC transporter permease [Alphaproteobacteria bacterium]